MAFLGREAEEGVEFAAAVGGEAEGAAVEFAGDPATGQGVGEKSGAEGSAEMRTALAPVQTAVGEAAALGTERFRIEAEGVKGGFSGGGELIGGAGAGGRGSGAGSWGRGDPAEGEKAVVEGDGEGSRHVVVAGARGAEGLGRGRDKASASDAGQDAEALEGASNFGSCEGVVAMAALGGDADEALGFEAAEMHAGSGGRDFGEDSQLGAGAGVAVEERAEHAGAGGLANGGGYGGDGGVFCIHGLTVNEAWVRSKGGESGNRQ